MDTENREISIVLALLIVAMFRVFFFNAAFPFFNNVDEILHFDTVVKYSKGYPPGKNPVFYDRESVNLFSLYGTPEYMKKPEELKTGKVPDPPGSVDKKAEYLTTLRNHEVHSPPVYYAVAGAWYRTGKLLGLGNGHLLYWVRFLNVGIFGLLVWFTYLVCGKLYKDDMYMRLGVPLLLAFFPQDLFYSISSDVLSPLLFSVSLYLLIRIYTAEGGPLLYLLTGLTVSATFLVKLTNATVLVVLTVFLVLTTREPDEGESRIRGPNLLFLLSAASIPIIVWLAWNLHALGDMTGTAEKIGILGWTKKPLREVWDHPVFTLDGFAFFLTKLTKTFWRGEFVWGLKAMSLRGMDLFYVISSFVFVPASLTGLIFSRNHLTPEQRLFNCLNAFTIFLFIMTLLMLSVLFDFGESRSPSRELPYFVHGRLMSGALIPFLILYVNGLGRIVSKITKRINPLIVVLLIGTLITCSEIYISLKAFESPYNWFHLF